MFSKALLAIAALGVVSVWYARSRAPFESAGSARGRPASDLPASLPTDATVQTMTDRLQHSQAMGVAGGIEPQAYDTEVQGLASTEHPGQTTWPASRESLGGA